MKFKEEKTKYRLNLQFIFNLHHRIENMCHLLWKTHHDDIFFSWNINDNVRARHFCQLFLTYFKLDEKNDRNQHKFGCLFVRQKKILKHYFSGTWKFQMVWYILFLLVCLFFFFNIFVLLFIFPVMSFRIESWHMLVQNLNI
jgi:hypothetical protein